MPASTPPDPAPPSDPAADTARGDGGARARADIPASASADPDPGPAGAAPGNPAGAAPGAGPAGPPRAVRVLGVWAACTLLTLVLARLGAQDTPATPWGGSAPSWLEHMAFWDAGWYERILTEGYPSVLLASADGVVQQNTWAFMPLLPLLAAASSSVTGLPFYASAALVSLTASAAAALGLDRWLAPRAGARQSLWAVALVWSSPCALVLQTPYAEALGLALTAAALGLAHRRRFLIAAPIAALACLSRPIGVPLAAALGLWWAWETACARGLVPDAVRALLPGARPLTARRRLGLLGLTAWTGAAALVWPVAAWAVTGRADAYTATETAWRGERLAPFQPWLTRSGWWVGEHLGPVLLAAVLALAALGLASRALRSLGPAAWFWCAGYVIYLLAFFDPTTSVFRLLLPLAPAAWALPALVRGRRGRAALLLGGVVGQLVWISWVWDLGSVAIRWVP